MAGEPDPSWTTDAARAVGHEVAAYARTVGTIARHPARFAADWSDGRVRALNPLAFLLNALAVLGPWRAAWAHVVDPNRPSTPLWFELMKPAFPVILNVCITSVMHALLLIFGARRPLRSSCAMAMSVSGGPGAVLNLLLAPLMLYGFLHPLER